MKRVTTLCLAAMLTVAAIAYGQTRATLSRAEQKATASWIGCLENGTTPNTFVLNVIQSASNAAAPAGVQDETGNIVAATSGRSPQQRIQLSAHSRVNLSAHMGHKVEITGIPMPQGSTRRAGDSTETRVTVSGVRMISSMCSSAGTSGTPGTIGTIGTSEPTLPNDGTGQVPEKKY